MRVGVLANVLRPGIDDALSRLDAWIKKDGHEVRYEDTSSPHCSPEAAYSDPAQVLGEADLVIGSRRQLEHPIALEPLFRCPMSPLTLVPATQAPQRAEPKVPLGAFSEGVHPSVEKPLLGATARKALTVVNKGSWIRPSSGSAEPRGHTQEPEPTLPVGNHSVNPKSLQALLETEMPPLVAVQAESSRKSASARHPDATLGVFRQSGDRNQ